MHAKFGVLSWRHVGALAALLVSAALSPALATCVSKRCPDATLVQQARATIEQTCGCTQAGKTHRAYMRCVKSALKPANLAALGLQRPCRNAVMRCESKSICGEPDAVVCCRTKKSGKVAASIRQSATKCKKGTACASSTGLYSTFDACNANGTCASQLATSTPTTTTTPTTTPCEAQRAAFEATLPVPTPAAPGRYVVQLVNESDVTLLAAANAAHKPNEPPFPVLPREGTWVIPSMGTLTIDIPVEWEGTVGLPGVGGAVGPLFWARTGCRFDIANNIAQCETGGCAGFYDCSKANLSTTGPKALAEWTFNDPNNRNWSFPDVSVVDGVNLNMDIEAIGPRTEHMPSEPKWLDHPLVQCGGDQRDTLWCPPSRFQLKRSQLPMFIQGSEGGDDVVACFSNCGLYKYPAEPTNFACNPDPATDLKCYYWKTFCATFPTPDGPFPYDIPCNSDADCTQGGACWNPCQPGVSCRQCNHSGPNSKTPGGGPACCALRAFNKQPDCPADQCTFPYTPQTPQNQPPFGLCSDVTNATGDPDACIGDDIFHYVMPYGLTWPNDPETFSSDAHAFRIVFAPGSTHTIPVTPAGPVPDCSSLPAAYDFAKASMDCSGVANKVFSSAVLPPTLWPCDVKAASIPDGVLCKW